MASQPSCVAPLAAQLSDRALRDLRDEIRNPLVGRPVRVSIGRKAFFRGKLTPAGSIVDELVVIQMTDGSSNAVNRIAVLELLQNNIEERRASDEVSKKVNTREAPTDSPTASVDSKTLIPHSTTSTAPLFEIREELDSEGNEVHAEAVNVTRHLDYLRQANHNRDNTGSAISLSQSSNAPLNQLDEESPLKDDDKHKRQLSDAEYEALVARLDHIAFLEEHEDSEKKTNSKSAHSLQSSGWSKGFFNKKATRNVLRSDTVETSTASSSAPKNDPHVKSVSFHDVNQVNEIPRIGEKSVSRYVSNRLKSLDPSLFPGTVVEKTRPKANQNANLSNMHGKRLSRFAQQRQGVLQAESADT